MHLVVLLLDAGKGRNGDEGISTIVQAKGHNLSPSEMNEKEYMFIHLRGSYLVPTVFSGI